jgi:hypothetical protein
VRREVYDYGHVLHEVQLNAWVLGLPPRLVKRLVGQLERLGQRVTLEPPVA